MNNGNERVMIATRAGIGVMEIIIAILLFFNLVQINKVVERADTIIRNHDGDVKRLEDTTQVRNNMFRMVADKLGIPAQDVEDLLDEDTLAAEGRRRRHRRTVTPQLEPKP